MAGVDAIGGRSLFFLLLAPVHGNGRADVDPVIKEAGGIAPVEMHADAPVRRGIVGNRGEAVNEVMAVKLNAVGHRRAVEEAGIVMPRLVGTCLVFARRCSVSP